MFVHFSLFLIVIRVMDLMAVILECQIGSKEKCPGQVKIISGVLDGNPRPFNTTENMNLDDCITFCVYNDYCFMATFDEQNKQCLLYDKVAMSGSGKHNIKIYTWTCCPMNRSEKQRNRCAGYWLYEEKHKTINDYRPNPLVTYNINENLCLNRCLKNIICSSVNTGFAGTGVTKRYICELIIGLPVDGLRRSKDTSLKTFIWACAPNYTVSYVTDTCRKYNLRWHIESNNSIMDKGVKAVSQFHSLQYLDCLDSCRLQKNCRRAWFSVHTWHCVIEVSNASSCSVNISPTEDRYITFIPQPCQSHKPDSSASHSNNCRQIKYAKHMRLHTDKCGHSPVNIGHKNHCGSLDCRKPSSIRKYYHCYSCQEPQSFRVISEKVFLEMQWFRVFSGYETFWLFNVTNGTFPLTSETKCLLYDSNFRRFGSSIQLVSRSMWYAQSPKRPPTEFPNLPLPQIVIAETTRPTCGCYTNVSCAEAMRFLQAEHQMEFSDVGFNFMVSGHGVIFEGVGWRVQSEGIKYSDISLVISLCGDFTYEPELLSLNAIKRLINFAVRQGWVAEDYMLLLMRDVDTSPNPGMGLSSVVQLWPHYRRHFRQNCLQMLPIKQTIAFVCVLAVVFLLIVLSHVFLLRLFHGKFCRKFRITALASTFYCSLTDQTFYDSLELYSVRDVRQRKELISPFTTKLFWIEDKLELMEHCPCNCQRALCAVFDLYRFQSKMVPVSILSSIQEINSCGKYTHFLFNGDFEIGLGMLMTSHSVYEVSSEKLMKLLSENHCTCFAFTISKYEPSCSGLELGVNCQQSVRSGRVQYSSIVEDLRLKFCYVDGPCLRYY